MRILTLAVLCTAPLALAACSNSTTAPKTVSASQAGVTYRVAADKVDSTRSFADEYCGKRNLRAQLDRVTPNGKTSLVSYFCVV